MKRTVLTLILGVLLLPSCTREKSFIEGSWSIENMNSIDTSANRVTLFGTFIVTSYREKSILSFSNDNKVSMFTADKKELGKGEYKLVENGTYLEIKFPSDKFKSRYKVLDKTDATINLMGNDEGETINLSLIKTE
jgi:hypothetical protein